MFGHEGANIVVPLRGRFRADIALAYFQTFDVPIAASTIDQALLVLEGLAGRKPKQAVPLRVARHGDGIVLDLHRDDGAIVLVRPEGWDMLDRSPVPMRRTDAGLALPVPERDGSVELFRQYLNVADDRCSLILGWLVAALVPDIAGNFGVRDPGLAACSTLEEVLATMAASGQHVSFRRMPSWDFQPLRERFGDELTEYVASFGHKSTTDNSTVEVANDDSEEW
jgi:hypothetical protein